MYFGIDADAITGPDAEKAEPTEPVVWQPESATTDTTDTAQASATRTICDAWRGTCFMEAGLGERNMGAQKPFVLLAPP